MQVVGADLLMAAVRKHPDAASALATWRQVTETATWDSLTDVRLTYPSADGVKVASGSVVTIFNIRGNKYRLITRIGYRSGTVLIVAMLTHAEYNKEQWKVRL